MLIDTHCHLDFPDFEDELDDVLDRAKAAGVSKMVTICTKVTQFDRIRAMADAHEDIYCSVGIHPHEAEKEPVTTTAELLELASHPKCIGIGETGLDYFYEHSPRKEQQANFREHIGASREAKLPLIVHTRDADEDTISILSEEKRNGDFPGLIHCFSSSEELAMASLELGLYISISGIVTFKKAVELRETLKNVPLDRILVETDAPYLAPVPHRGKRNEPSFVADTAAKVAEIKGVSTEEMARISTENFYRLFSKAA